MYMVPRDVHGIIHSPLQYLLKISALVLCVKIGVRYAESSVKYHLELGKKMRL